MRMLLLSLTIAALAFSMGCAHAIRITPSQESLATDNTDRIHKNVAYYISPEDLVLRVITPAGGGDKVKYFPYKESEAALDTILESIFDEVHALSSLDDSEFIRSNQIDFVFKPKLKTDSVGRSAWIWPPSDFTMVIDCQATDESGSVVWEESVTGEAHLALGSVHFDHGRAGRHATKAAYLALHAKILKSNVFR